MAIIGNNPLLKTARGMFGDTHYYRMWRGRLVMCKRPKRRKGLSRKQKQTVARFKLAAAYAAKQMKDEEVKAAYQARTNFRYHSAYLVALNDYLNPPRVDEIRCVDYRGAIGDVITIDAYDEFEVVRVSVVIRNKDGSILEEGPAVKSHNPNLWKYTATVVNSTLPGTTILAMAFDRPGNQGIAEVAL